MANGLKGQECLIDGLYVQSFGDTSKPALLLSAGLGGAGAYWAPQLPDFTEDYYVILYDQRGTGRSDRSALPVGYSVAHMADDIKLVMDGLHLSKAHIMGHAAGGVAGLDLAMRYPARVSSLIVINGWAKASRHFCRCMQVRKKILQADGVMAYLQAQPSYIYPADWIEDHFDLIEAELEAHAHSFQDTDTLFARMDALAAFTLDGDLTGYTTPTLLVSAKDDALVPASASSKLKKLLPSAQLEVFPHGGHAVNITNTPQFNAVTRSYLAKVTENNGHP